VPIVNLYINGINRVDSIWEEAWSLGSHEYQGFLCMDSVSVYHQRIVVSKSVLSVWFILTDGCQTFQA
jgi:hypothetical protein